MSLKPWREIAVPHEDVLKGTFQQAEFAADWTPGADARLGVWEALHQMIRALAYRLHTLCER